MSLQAPSTTDWNEPGNVSRMYERYVGPVGFEFAQFVGRYEDRVDDLIHVLAVLDQTFEVDILHKLDPINVSRKTCGEPVWDPDLKRRMLALEAPAIRRFYPEWIDPSRTLREYPTSTAGLKSLARRVFARKRENASIRSLPPGGRMAIDQAASSTFIRVFPFSACQKDIGWGHQRSLHHLLDDDVRMLLLHEFAIKGILP